MARSHGFNHAEAFSLMWYQCSCGHRERMWNSRDGVTAFCCKCPSCGKLDLTHVEWNKDFLAQDHQPHKGQRVWRDGKPEEAVAIIENRLACFKAAGHEQPTSIQKEMFDDARNTEGEWCKGWPVLVVWNDSAA